MKSCSCKSFKLFMFVAACFILSMFYGCSNFFQDVMDNVSDIEVDYKVEHWKQALDGKSYELDPQETQTLQGISLAKTQAQAKDFEGFTSQKIDQQKIKRDGTTVVKLYYNRKSVTYIFKAEGGNWNEDSADQTKTGLYGAALDIPENPVKTGYTFSNWSSDVPETFGASDITFVANWLPGTGTLYKVEYYLQNMDGSDYERIDDDCQNLVGTTGELTVATAKEYEGFTVEDITQKEIAPDGSTVVPVYYTRNSISYIFTANGGNWNGSSDNKTVSGLYECSVTAPGAPVKTGYVFGGWSEEVPESFGTEAKSFSAVWLASTNTVYRVEHWQQNIDDDEYTMIADDTQSLTGTTYGQTNASAKLYTGFTAKSLAQGVIAPDGSTVIKVMYDRNRVTYTFNSVEGHFSDSSLSKIVSGRYGASVNIPESPLRTGYAFRAWNNTIPTTFETSDIIFVPIWTANPDTVYKVEHWQQNINDNDYTKVSTDEKQGTTATPTQAVANSYEGFTSQEVTQKIINADGNTVVRINYNRNTITYTFDPNGGNWSGNTTNETRTGRYGAEFSISNPDRIGYTFRSWNSIVPSTFGAENITFTTNWDPNTNTSYKVEHYQQDVNDNVYTIVSSDTQNLTGITDAQTSASVKSYEGFTAKAFTQKVIAADGNTVVKIYYDRNQIKYTFNSGEGKFNDNTTSKVVSGRYGATVTVPGNLVRTGYTFNTWNDTIPSSFGSSAATFTALWNINSYTVTFNSNGGSTVSAQTINYNNKATSPSAPTKTGYTFGGWYTNSGLTTSYDFNTAVTGNITLHAKWNINSYTVTFNSNGGSTVSAQTINYNNKATSPSAPTKTGYTFGGWYTNSGLTTSYDFNTAVIGNITLYAKWNINSYTVTFVVNGGTAVASQTVVYNQKAKRPSVNPTKANHTFINWYSNSSLTTKFNFDTPITTSTTIYAKWFINPVEKISINGTQYDKTEEVCVMTESVTINGENTNYASSGTDLSYTGVFPNGRTVTLSPFVISKYEVTQELYEAVMTGNNYSVRSKNTDLYNVGSLLPVGNITWYDAIYFCNLLTEKTLGLNAKVYSITNVAVNEGHIKTAKVSIDRSKEGYRLPTEAEWEFAARGGDPLASDWNYLYSGHLSDPEKVAWYKVMSTYNVGRKSPNRLGLYDMNGNVGEWCYDYGASCELGNVIDPYGPLSGSVRIVRGGGWNTGDSKKETVCYRDSLSPGQKTTSIGFRVVRSRSE